MQHSIIALYLFVTGAAFLYTMTRIWTPIIPRQILLFSYGMMAPYQRDSEWNYDVVAEGQLADGSWEQIDLKAYYPYEPGEGVIRRQLTTYQKLLSKELRQRRFTDLAIMLLDRERAKGKPYVGVRLWSHKWGRSPAGYEYLRRPPMLMTDLLADVR